MGASDLTWACLWYAPSVIVGAMGIGRTEHVAWLAASVRIVMALHTFVFLYFFNMLPNLSTELSRGLEDWRDLIRRSLGTAMWPACLVALGGTLAAPFIVTLLFGDAYREAVLPFQIVVWMIPITWFSGHYRFSLIAAGQQKWEFWAAAWSAVAMIPAAVVLVFSYGSAGAAVALVFGSLVNTALAMLAVKRRIGSVEALPALSPVVATCLASLVLGMLVALVAGEIPGAVTACIAYAGVAATRAAELTRARIAWLGR
jgi:O-antigen/teichoic acid export membrane protein